MVGSARSRALASAVALAAAAAALAGAPRVAALDPCRSQPDAVQRDDGFVVGLALGGSDAVVWDGRHPCNAADRAALAGVKVVAYRTRADELDALRFECDQLGSGKELSPGEHEDLMMRCPASWAVRMDDTFERFPNASVVAFARHGQSLKRSPPRPFRTVLGAGDPSGATAAHVTELRLVLRFVDGMLDSLLWADTGCSKCEGVTGQAQAASHTCVADNCALRNTYCLTEATEGLDNVEDCRLRVYVSWAGTDSAGVPLKSAKQLASIGNLAVSGAAISAAITGIDATKDVVGEVTDGVNNAINKTVETFDVRR